MKQASPDNSNNADSASSSTAWITLKILLAVLLMSTAGAKIWNIAATLESGGLLSVRSLLLAVIFWEVCLAVYLMLGDAQCSWRLSLLTFCSFACAAAFALLTGRSCNCISQQIPTELMLVLDIFIVGALLFTKPTRASQSAHRTDIPNIVISLAAGAVAVVAAMAVEQQTDVADPLQFILAKESRENPGHWIRPSIPV